MRAGALEIKRPAVLSLVGLLLAGAVAAGGAGLARLHADVAAGPETLVSAQLPLEQALADAPFAVVGDGPLILERTVWIVARVDEHATAPAFSQALEALDAADLDVRLLLVAGPDDSEAAVAATLAQTQDRAVFDAWRRGEPWPTSIDDPAEFEGYLELARQSADRLEDVLTANEIEPDLPLVIWRRGADWRAVVGHDPHVARRVRRDLAAIG
jgi:hypothetical protein